MLRFARVIAVVVAGLGVLGAPAAVAAPGGGAGEPAVDPLAAADAIAGEVAKLRGLKIRRAIRRGVKDRDAIRASVLRSIERDVSDEQLAVEQRVLQRLGMLAEGVDYKTLLVDVATEQIAGFYDPWDQQLYIAEGIELTAAATALDDGPMVLAHEIDHALQDQHFDLRAFMDAVPDTNGDAAIARQALVEGDGMALMVEYMFARLGADPPWGDPKVARELERALAGAPSEDTLAGAPLIVQASMLFPYASGLRFVMSYRRHHPWRRIDKMYARPPLSSEHILHPRSYSRYERPDRVTARPVAALAGYRLVRRDVTGELGFATLLRQHGVGAATADVAAAGWGGDRLAVYAPDEDDGTVASAVAISYSVWDDEADAIELFDAAADALEALAGGEATARGDALTVYPDARGGVTSVQRDGDTVLIVIGAPAKIAEAVRAQVPRRWKLERR